MVRECRVAGGKVELILAFALMLACGQVSLCQISAPNQAAFRSDVEPARTVANSDDRGAGSAERDLESCHAYKVKSLPGSQRFGSDFIVAIAGDPDPEAADRDAVWGLTVDVSDTIPSQDRAMYISKSTDNGATWNQVVRLDSRYFDAKIGEGLRNELSVSPGGTDFVITTQRGAFQVFPGSGTSDAMVRAIPGPRVPRPRPRLTRPKRPGDPIMAGVVRMTGDGKHMMVGYGYFDLNPRIFTYHRDEAGSWIEDKPLPHLPSNLDILSLEFDDSRSVSPGALYLGTGDQAYILDLQTMKWRRITGVGPDSAIHAMSIVGGPHLAACWGVYNPLSADAVKRVTDARFLLHRGKDEVGPNIRAYGISVDPSRPNREVVTAITGAYISDDSGQTWKRLNDLPEGEFRTAHFNSDGSVIVSGLPGTFLVNPFSDACSPRLRTRD